MTWHEDAPLPSSEPTDPVAWMAWYEEQVRLDAELVESMRAHPAGAALDAVIQKIIDKRLGGSA